MESSLFIFFSAQHSLLWLLFGLWELYKLYLFPSSPLNRIPVLKAFSHFPPAAIHTHKTIQRSVNSVKGEGLLSCRRSGLVSASAHVSLPARCDLTWTFPKFICNQIGKENKQSNKICLGP